MHATALICDERQQFSLQPVVLPDPSADQIAIRTHFSGVSIGTEFALIRGKLSWGPYPLCTGYMGTGIIEAAGANVAGLQVGDAVYFRHNAKMALLEGQSVSCVSGAHCSHVVLHPGGTHGAARLPDGVGLDVASLYVPPAVGLYGVDMANPRMGERVVVHGTGLVGLGVVAACAHRGCSVVAVDIVPRHLEIARALGAEYTIDAARQDIIAEVRRIAPKGADVVFECTGLPACINTTVELCRTDGTFVWQGNYGAAPLAFNFLPAHGRRLRMFFPCDDGLAPCRHAVIANMARGALQWEHTITHRIDYTEAPALFERINTGAERDVVGAVVRWSQ